MKGSFDFPGSSTDSPPAPRSVLQKPTHPARRKLIVLISLLCIGLGGCLPVRRAPLEPIPPKEVARRYLKGMFNPAIQREMYDLLTAKARGVISYQSFVFVRNNEVLVLVGSRTATDTRVSVSFFDQYNFSEVHSVVYCLLTVHHPYSIGEREKYALVRLHCRKEGGGWRIEPFLHAATGTVILIPTRMRGPLWRISDDMEQIAKLVSDEISTYEKQRNPPPEKVMSAESPGEPPLVIPDVIGPEPAEVPPAELDKAKKLEALISIGRLCYEAGKIDAAEDTFRRVLALDPESDIAKDYLSRCENYRLLKKEKGEAAKLIEELLHLESEKPSTK